MVDLLIDPVVAGDAGLSATLDGPVATITLNRPERLNVQTPQLWDALTAIAAALPGSVRVVVLRGAGTSFSAGLDTAMFDPGAIAGAPSLSDLAGDEAATLATIARWQRAFDWSSRPALVSIAAVRGHAIGAGFQLALGADIRIIADDASFAMAEARLGLVPDLGGTKRLVELVGYSRAAEICLTGRAVAADEAMRIGLASSLVPVDDLDDAVGRTVQALLAVDRDAAIETKALLLGALARTLQQQQAAEREAQYRLLHAMAAASHASQAAATSTDAPTD